MAINNQNSSGMMNGMPPAPVPQPEKKIGPIVGVLIIVLVLVVAALYFFAQKLNTESVPAQTTAAVQQSTTPIPGETMAANVSSADDISAMQADLNSELKDVDYSF